MRKLLLAIAMLASPALADGDPYWKGQGYFVYHEDRSCALYVDFDDGGMLRVSDRRDENRAYVMIVNTKWNSFAEREGAVFTMSLASPSLKVGYGSAAQVIRNVDGRFGFSGGDYPNGELLDMLARTDVLSISAVGTHLRPTTLVNLGLPGSAVAVAKLRECSGRFFR